MDINMKKSIEVFLNKYLFVIGLTIVFLSVIPYLILGEQAVVPYHDQLDGELIAYIYQAKYLLSGQEVIPEFLNGASKTALLPPAPLAVLFFKVLSPFAALVLMQIIGQVVGYIGAFRLTELVTDKKMVSFVAALLYAFLPFLPVYGLSQYGMPLLLLCICHLYHAKTFREKKVKGSLFYVACYAAMSSLVLCGFAWLAVWMLILLLGVIRKKIKEQQPLLTGFLVLLGVYVVENATLLGQMLGIGNNSLSHKSEYAMAGGEFFSGFWNYLKYNGEHSADNHLWIGCLATVVVLLVVIFHKKWEARVLKQCKYMIGTLGIICVFSLLAAFWDCSFGVAVREHLGALGAFQMDRVLWLAPMLWIVVLAFCLDILWSARAYAKWLAYGASLILLGCVGVVTLKNSLVKPCVQKILNPDYAAITYADYLAIGVLNQVEDFMTETEGMQKEAYKVASLGIDPAAALYHGFYCVDGYSNNYDLEYKHAFRKVISPELEKSDYLKDYYDNWGNRCYLFSAECPGYYTIEKGGFAFYTLELDTVALKELGCDYIFSATYVVNAEENGLLLLNESPFETTDSYYQIFVYKICI